MQHGNLHGVIDYKKLIQSQANQVTFPNCENLGAKKSDFIKKK